MIKFRTLRGDEIECRVSTVSEKGCSLLLYKDARCDMNILDETVGPENWQRRHYEVKGNLHCEVSVWDSDKKQWVSKADCGTESFTEKEKGECSDSFKRACFNWGIGRELYTAPFIWVPADKVKLSRRGEKWTTFDRFRVEKIIIDDAKHITALAIMNDTSKCRAFVWQEKG